MPIFHWLTRDKDIRAAAWVPYRLLDEATEIPGQFQDFPGRRWVPRIQVPLIRSIFPGAELPWSEHWSWQEARGCAGVFPPTKAA